ncbi:MAG: mevalonate kinase [Methanobacteriota archaeon]
MGKGIGYGKVILFGEHFVVHGVPSIASAIDSKTVATVHRVPAGKMPEPSGAEGSMSGDGWVMEDDRQANPGYKTEKHPQQKRSIELVFQGAGFDPRKNPVKIHLGGDLIAVGGVGASAAVCVSVARALSGEFGLGFDDKRINDIAFLGDSAYAGTPSGIDNTASTFGGLLWFVKNPGAASTMERLRIKEPLRIVMGNTLLTTNTEAAVAGVRKRKGEQPEKYEAIFNRARAIALKARAALEAYDVAELGRLMDENHALLQQIEVSHPKLDELVGIARANGAAGAKMTGGGLGGYMVALTPGKGVQDGVAAAMEKAGYKALKTTIGV